jgi:hypothetical protein
MLARKEQASQPLLLHGILFDPEAGGNILFRNISSFL